ncbi:MAG: pyridoxine 5'-phosphate synthase [Cytophagaceae bacterium]
MTRLSVNINKIATLRNSRGGNKPDVIQAAIDCEKFGAQGITVHPRPDERHIRYDDVYELKKVVKTEFNIEGFPEKKFIYLIENVKPHQVTLVPDPPNAITSNNGWDTLKNQTFLKEIVSHCKKIGCRVSVFVNPEINMIHGAATCEADRIELYTEPYAKEFYLDKAKAILPYKIAAEKSLQLGMEVNAGHDLNLDNLNYLKREIPNLAEVSIGHALIADALYYGLENTIQMYLKQLL